MTYNIIGMTFNIISGNIFLQLYIPFALELSLHETYPILKYIDIVMCVCVYASF